MKIKILILGPTKNIGGKANFTRLVLEHFKLNSNYNIRHLDTTRSLRKRRSLSKIPAVGYRYLLSNSIVRFIDVSAKIVADKFRFILTLFLFKPDYVQIHTSSYFDFIDNSVYIIISKIFNINVVLRIGGGAFEKFIMNSMRPLKIYIISVLNMTNYLIVQSDYWREIVTRYATKPKTAIIPNMVNYQEWVSTKVVCSQPKETFNILFIPGYEEHIKGYYDLMPTFADLSTQFSDMVLTIVALGRPLENEYLHLLDKRKIQLYDKIEGKEKITVFKSAALYVLPTYMEGFPNTIIEAMAAGVPIVSTYIPPIRAILTDHENAILISPGDKVELAEAIIKLYQDSNLRSTFSLNNKKKCEAQYNTTKMISYFSQIYKNN